MGGGCLQTLFVEGCADIPAWAAEQKAIFLLPAADPAKSSTEHHKEADGLKEYLALVIHSKLKWGLVADIPLYLEKITQSDLQRKLFYANLEPLYITSALQDALFNQKVSLLWN